LKSTEISHRRLRSARVFNFSNFGSLKSTEICPRPRNSVPGNYFSNFGSLKSTEIPKMACKARSASQFQQFRLVEEH